MVEINCVGICGSDLKFYLTGKCGIEVLSEPVVLGHEGAGVVIKVLSIYVYFLLIPKCVNVESKKFNIKNKNTVQAIGIL